ncbi:MAG: adenine phosphoribosyltransferase [Microcystis panniformis]
MDLKSLIRDIPDFPKPGIVFRDITTLLNHPQGLRYTIDTLTAKCRDYGLSPDYIVGMESRGFLFGVPLAYQLEAGFIPVRKPGKLPAAVHSIEYDLEYGSATIEMHVNSLNPDWNVLVHDDLLATGGTASAAAELIKMQNARVAGFSFVVELEFLNGSQMLAKHETPIHSLIKY